MDFIGTCGTVMGYAHYGPHGKPSQWRRRLHHRVCEVLIGVEHIIAGLLCDAVWTKFGPLPGGGVWVNHKVRWWNPAAWVGWFRTIVLGDRCGSAYYKRRAKR